MSGIGLLLNTAKDALFTQQLALDVVGHNIANVNTTGYTRQIPHIQAKTPAPYAGLMLGRGAVLDDVLQSTDNFVETRLKQRTSDLMASEEKEIFLSLLEGIFDENSAQSISAQLSEFWNAWHELVNDPSGLAERSILYEKGSLLSQAFRSVSDDLFQLTQDLNLSLRAAVEEVNDLLSRIADLNQQIIGAGVTSNANDLRDQRNQLVTQLSEYLDIRYYENQYGDLTVTTGRGYMLVSGSEPSALNYDGHNVIWQSSGGASRDITDIITGGKIGGWLDLRDTIIPQVESDLNELAGSIIWEVNGIHAQGVGLEGFTSLTATHAVADSTEELGTLDSGLSFYDGIADGSFELWLYDGVGNVVGSATITIDADAGGTTLDSLIADLNAIDPAHLTATNSGGRLQIAASGGYSFAFSNDTSNVMAALGVNTFFAGSQSANMDMNASIETNKNLIAAGRVSSSGEIASGDNSNALEIADLQYVDVTMRRFQFERGNPAPMEQVVTDTLENYLHTLIGSIGIQSQSAARSKEYNEVIVGRLKETRESVSGVSIDEELANIIKYQHAYAAAARLITAADEMYRSLLEIK